MRPESGGFPGPNRASETMLRGTSLCTQLSPSNPLHCLLALPLTLHIQSLHSTGGPSYIPALVLRLHVQVSHPHKLSIIRGCLSLSNFKAHSYLFFLAPGLVSPGTPQLQSGKCIWVTPNQPLLSLSAPAISTSHLWVQKAKPTSCSHPPSLVPTGTSGWYCPAVPCLSSARHQRGVHPPQGRTDHLLPLSGCCPRSSRGCLRSALTE